MLGFALIGAVLAVWLVMIAVILHGKGDVGVTPAVQQRIKLRIAVANMERVIGEQFVPALRAMTDVLVKVNADMKKLRVHLR